MLRSQLPVLAQKKTIQNILRTSRRAGRRACLEGETLGSARQTFVDFRRDSLTAAASGIDLCKGKQLLLIHTLATIILTVKSENSEGLFFFFSFS